MQFYLKGILRHALKGFTACFEGDKASALSGLRHAPEGGYKQVMTPTAGRVRLFSKYHRSGRVGSGRAGPGRVGSGRNVFKLSRTGPTRPDPRDWIKSVNSPGYEWMVEKLTMTEASSPE